MFSKILASNQQEANGIKNLSAHSKSAKELDAIVYELHQLHHERKANGKEYLQQCFRHNLKCKDRSGQILYALARQKHFGVLKVVG